VSQPADKSDADTLPDPELNPLLNPLLAAHMGRWAEVYFTNPPEKREQAVSELLRELQSVPSVEAVPVQVANESEREIGVATESPSPNSPPAKWEPVLTCSVCAYNNSLGQRFCGMCAAPLQASPEPYVPRVAETMSTGTSWLERSLGENPVEDEIEPAVSSTAPQERHPAIEPSWRLPEKDLLHFVAESGLDSYRNRIYLGTVLAILLVLLGFMAWRGTRALSRAAGSPSAPTSTRMMPAEQPAPAALAAPPNATDRALPANTLPANTAPASPVKAEIPPAASSPKDQATDSGTAARIVPVAANSASDVASPVPVQSGAQELAMAEKYLNGGPGVPRDSEEGVRWLWKAVGKGNPAATVTLSDLLLRGDGVPKNCGQAQVLLDAAAKKGSKTAAERLTNLQAFGCE
jgi:hypothetical protein